MRKIVTFFAVSLVLSFVLASCGATKHGSKCDAYGSLQHTTGDLAKK
jgi:hypothetical protein